MRLAMFGGTFDPIHQAHIAVASAAQARFQLDRILLIPNHVPPHKPETQRTPYHHRLEMVRLACLDQPKLEASDLEASPTKSFSIDTISRLQALIPIAQLFFIIGADAFNEVHLWYRWQEVLAAVEFIVISRPGSILQNPYGARAHLLDGLDLPISSSAIRKRLAQGLEPGLQPEGMIPAVFNYIRQNGLYRVRSKISL
jgi:nicotinate-nucleotide adenylyltransferase